MLPKEFLARMERQLGEEYPEYLASLQRPRAAALRFNPLKGEPPRLPFVTEAVPWEPMGYYFDPQARPGLHPYHEAGVYYLQEASAMAPVALLDPKPGERICDLCAAPGGKSTQIAGRLMGRGFLLCNEYSPKRAKILSRNVERMGIANALVTNESPERLAKALPGYFDRVLVDAPCSGEGMFRKEEAAVTDWSEDTVAMCAKRQGEILTQAAKLVRPGGLLVYSTCTFAPQEDEEAVEKFLRAHPDFVPEPPEAPWFTPGPNGSFRLWPHKLRGEGHFAAVLRRMGTEEVPPAPRGGEPLPKEGKDFLRKLGIELPPGRPVTFGDTVYWAPEDCPELKGMKVLRPGLELGQLLRGRFQPAHALALWLPGCAGQVDFPSDSPEMKAYLHGDVLPGREKGWVQVQCGGFGIGWAKGDGVQLKNHYPKGLRRN